ncbi:MAG: hypothetical protein ACOCV9_05280 [Marinilabiliaceae bacterium]
MGITIHYNGRFNKDASLLEMVHEVKDIAEVCEWDYTVFNEDFPEKTDSLDTYNDEIYGIELTPPNCESVSLCFLSNRRMSCAMQLMLWGNADPSEEKYLYQLFTKTQFAGVDVHKFIIHLFRYLEEKNFFEHLEVNDEGRYWETGDEEVLKKQFRKNAAILDSFSFALENVPREPGESFQSYFERIIKILSQK